MIRRTINSLFSGKQKVALAKRMGRSIVDVPFCGNKECRGKCWRCK